MSNLLLPPDELSSEVASYDKELQYYLDSSSFPVGLLSSPDHVMIKTRPADFGERARRIKQWAEYTAFTQVDWRFLVAAHLLTPVSLLHQKPVSWVEVMEAKSPDGTVDFIGVEYTSFYFDNYNAAAQLLERKGIAYEQRADGQHRWLSVKVNNKGREVRITDKHLAQTINEELDNRTAL